MTDDLVQRLRADVFYGDARLANMDKHNPLHMDAADRIEQLEREKAVLSDLWKQQKEIALDYLTDCNKAADRIEAQAAEIEQWRECALYDATMEGPVFKGWNRSALERCRRAALEARGFEIREKGR